MVRCQLMQILNVTPDSFSDGGELLSPESQTIAPEPLLEKARAGLKAGAVVLDVGGESTRPGAREVDAAEESRRVTPAIAFLRGAFPEVTLSVDTRKADVAAAAVAAGADWINDVSGLQQDPDMIQVLKDHIAPFPQRRRYVLTHSQGTPETMQQNPTYEHGVLHGVREFFTSQIERLLSAGLQQHQIILDPGFGFGKTVPHNLELLHCIGDLATSFPNFSWLIGISRKSFLVLGDKEGIPPHERDRLTAAAHALIVDRLSPHNCTVYFRVHETSCHTPILQFLEAFTAFAPLSSCAQRSA